MNSASRAPRNMAEFRPQSRPSMVVTASENARFPRGAVTSGRLTACEVMAPHSSGGFAPPAARSLRTRHSAEERDADVVEGFRGPTCRDRPGSSLSDVASSASATSRKRVTWWFTSATRPAALPQQATTLIMIGVVAMGMGTRPRGKRSDSEALSRVWTFYMWPRMSLVGPVR